MLVKRSKLGVRLAGCMLAGCCALLVCGSAQASLLLLQESAERTQFSDAEAKAVQHDLAQMHIVQAGLSRFHKVNGRWPAAWEDVVTEGICQRDLYSASGLRIDPDDGSLDFMFDCLYAGADGEGQAVIRYQGQDGRAATTQLKPPESYAKVLSRLKRSAEGEEGLDPKLFDQVAADSPGLRLFALAGVCNELLMRFRVDQGRYPQSVSEFVDSGYAPFGQHAVNPRTGGPLLSDGISEGLLIPTAKSGALTGLTYPVLPGGRFPATNAY